MTEQTGGAEMRGRSSLTGGGAAIRGEKSWTFLYLVAGFAVSAEGTVVQLIEPIPWWARLVLFLGLASATLRTVLWDGNAQDWLLRWQAKHEGTPR